MANEHEETNGWLREDIREIRTAVAGLVRDLGNLRSEFACQEDFDQLRNRVDSLERDRAKMLGIILALNGVIAILGFLVNHFWK